MSIIEKDTANISTEVVKNMWRIKPPRSLLTKWGWYDEATNYRARYYVEPCADNQRFVTLRKIFDIRRTMTGACTVVPEVGRKHCTMQMSSKILGKFKDIRADKTQAVLLQDGSIRIYFPLGLTKLHDNVTVIDRLTPRTLEHSDKRPKTKDGSLTNRRTTAHIAVHHSAIASVIKEIIPQHVQERADTENGLAIAIAEVLERAFGINIGRRDDNDDGED